MRSARLLIVGALFIAGMLGGLATSAFGKDESAVRRPNIIVVLTDDQRWDSLGCTGSSTAQTPNIDRIAREGICFDNFFVGTPLCSPSRASFLTGLYPHKHRIINNDKIGLDAISHSLVTFPRMLRESGYETAFIGKWHMGLDDSRRPGFDHWISFKGQGLYVDGVVNVDGQQRQLTGYMTDWLNRWALEFVNKQHDKPFLLYLSHKAVHGPYLPAERHESLYADYHFTPPASAQEDLSGKPVMQRRPGRVDVLRLEGAVPEPGEPRRGRGHSPEEICRDQLRCLAAVDEGVGQLFEALEKQGALDDTIIVYTADNGYLMGEHKQFDTKRYAYEESIRVPFLVRYPKLAKGGTRRKQLTLNIDLAPTLLEIAGVEPFEPLHGKSVVPVLRDEQVPWRSSILTEYFLEKVVPGVPDWQSVRTERWKYIHFPGLEGLDELYDLAKDPHELKNLAQDDSVAGTLAELQAKLARLLERTGSR